MPERLIETCANLGMPGIALLDRDGIYGAPRFHMAAQKIRLKAHIGAEVTCESLPQRHGATENISDLRLQIADLKNRKPESICNSYRLPVLASSRNGYQNLCRLITKMKLCAKKGEGAVREEELEEHAHGLICLTGGDNGPLASAFARGGIEEAHRSVEQLTRMFGRENVYIEIQAKRYAQARAI